MPLKLRKNNSLELGSIYTYEDKNYLVIRSDYEKSKAFEVENLDDMSKLDLNNIKNFYNEDAKIYAKPKLVKKQAKNFKLGEFIMQDGLMYILDEINDNELIFTDYPKSNCPIYFFSPLDSSLMFLKEFKVLTEEDIKNQELELQREIERNAKEREQQAIK
ncbi:MAG: hypothetical protein ACRCXZ_06785 [Patescibacteria group bacterium]